MLVCVCWVGERERERLSGCGHLHKKALKDLLSTADVFLSTVNCINLYFPSMYDSCFSEGQVLWQSFDNHDRSFANQNIHAQMACDHPTVWKTMGLE